MIASNEIEISESLGESEAELKLDLVVMPKLVSRRQRFASSLG